MGIHDNLGGRMRQWFVSRTPKVVPIDLPDPLKLRKSTNQLVRAPPRSRSALPTPYFVIIFLRCITTIEQLRNIFSAIWLLVSPSAIYRSTSSYHSPDEMPLDTFIEISENIFGK
ncbi:hypothetical protein CLV26_10863 [Parapedobacter indicus]|nr:hypothetical protein CLV26_10863 [Parapedobacter indicus]